MKDLENASSELPACFGLQVKVTFTAITNRRVQNLSCFQMWLLHGFGNIELPKDSC